VARRRTGAAPLVFIVALAAVMLGTVLVQGWSPALGLDLQGGVSVVYQATNDVPDDALDDTIEIIRSRVDDLGVAEPEIVRQGDAIVVSLPGVTDRERALEVIGRTAELRFRPVLTSQQYITQAQLDAATSTTTTAPGATTSTTVDPAAPSTTAVLTDGSSSTTSTTVADEGAFAPAGLPPGQPGELAAPAQDATTTTTTATTVPVDPAATTTTAPVDPDAVPPPPGSEPLDFSGCALLGTTTTLEEDTPEATVILPGRDDGATQEEDDDDEPELCYQLGPVPTDGERSLTGTIVSGPEAQINAGEWGVSLNIKGDDLPLFNQVSAECFSRGPTCPTGQLAIVIDGEVQSAPSINEPSFTGQGLTISGNFDQSRADDLALVLRSGALPVELEAQTVQTVSATLGEESLRAGVIAGLIGVALVVLYLLVYYRVLAVVVVLGTLLWSALNYGIIAYLGETQSLALSLSGVTGIVISIGVTVDSYVVYFERLKDEVRSGRTFRSSVDRGFTRAFRTILAANVSSLIGAGLLYVLTVGPVRGFAFFLGLSTLLGLAVAWFFTRPLMGLLARSKFFTEHRFLGVARGLGASSPAAAATTGVVR
jgi:preprotein translocase subunit SecD